MRRPFAFLLAAVLVGVASAARPATASHPPFVVALLVDTSGSVGGPEIDRARRLAESLLDGLPAGSEIAVFRFDDQSKLVLPRTAKREDVRRALARLAPAGRKTALNDALFDGLKYVRETPGGRGAVVLITDGLDEDSAVDLDDGLRVAEGARIPVYTIGVGKVREKSLRRIAKLTGGDYLPIAAAHGAVIAKSIAASAAAAPPDATAGPAAGAPDVATSPQAPRPSPAAVAVSPVPRPTVATSAAPAPASRWIWPVLGALLVAGGAAALVASRRGREARCPTCKRPLPHPFSACAFCAPDETGKDSTTLKGSELSDTMMTKLNTTEEYLERTITLQDRPVLKVTKGLGMGRSFGLSAESTTSIGRARANDIALEDVAVSSEHCRVRLEDGRFVVHDLKSTNGTFVNDKRITRHALEDGDVLQVGETYLTFKREHRRV